MPVILTTQETEIGRLTVPGCYGKKTNRQYLSKETACGGCICHPDYERPQIESSQSEPSPGQKQETIQKNK
jgi:hypothetical protein